MSARFENRCVITEERMKRCVKDMKFWIPLGTMHLIGWAIVTILVLAEGSWAGFWLFGAFGVLLIPVLIALPGWEAKIIMWRLRRAYGNRIPPSVTKFAEVIRTNDPDGSKVFSYTQIGEVKRLADCYGLFFGREWIFLDPNGFTKGTFEDFKQFLRTKRPDLKIPE